MAWTTPRTWATSDVVTAAMLNTNVRDNANWLHAMHGCRLWKSANQTVALNATDVVNWNSEVYDTDTLHDTATNNSRITIPSGLDGYWQFIVKLNTDADGANHNPFVLRLRKNAAGSGSGGTAMDAWSLTGHTNAASNTATAVYNLVATDHIEAFLTSTSEARDVVGGGSTDSGFTAIYLGV